MSIRRTHSVDHLRFIIFATQIIIKSIVFFLILLLYIIFKVFIAQGKQILHLSVSCACFAQSFFQCRTLFIDFLLRSFLSRCKGFFFFLKILESVLLFNLDSRDLVFELGFDVIVNLSRVLLEDGSVTYQL